MNMSQALDPARRELLSRVSRRSSRSSQNSERSPYYGRCTPKASFFGRTQSFQEQPNGLGSVYMPTETVKIQLTDPRWAGLVLHSAAVGFVSAVLPLSVYPFLTAYLNMEGTQTLSARTLLALPWVLRPLFRVLMDCSPSLFSSRHRPNLVLGWLIACVALCSIVFIDIPEPFLSDLETQVNSLSNATNVDVFAGNPDAPAQGAIYVMLMSVATLGFVLADVAADALVGQIASRHFPAAPPELESLFETTVTRVRYGAMLLSFLFMGFAMSGGAYGGDFTFTLSYNEVMLTVGVISSIPMLFGMFMIENGPAEPRSSFAVSFQMMWAVFQNRAINYVIACRFLGGIFGSISATPVSPIALYYANVQPLNDNVVSFVGTLLVLVVIHLAEKKGWAINHLRVIVGATVLAIVLDCGVTMFTIWNLVRSQWLWIGLPVVDALPSALEFVILNVILNEITDPGTEDLARDLLTAVSFLAPAVGISVTKHIGAEFRLSNLDIMRDTTTVRTDATIVFLIAYMCQLSSILWLQLVPQQGQDAREWPLRSRLSKLQGALLVGVLALALVWSTTVHVLSVVESTSCLWIAGGHGC